MHGRTNGVARRREDEKKHKKENAKRKYNRKGVMGRKKINDKREMQARGREKGDKKRGEK